MKRLTEQERNSDGTGISKQSLIDRPGKGYPSSYCRQILTKLADYEDLEEQGKLLKLPCKIGDTVWDNDFGQSCSYTVTGFSFGKIDDDEESDIKGLRMYYRNWNGSICCSCAVSEIGKTVFLTRKSALQKMNEMEED